eukprot:scaffold7346_cov245-Pinguiococcus_pyrenoidosus.AAC.33
MDGEGLIEGTLRVHFQRENRHIDRVRHVVVFVAFVRRAEPRICQVQAQEFVVSGVFCVRVQERIALLAALLAFARRRYLTAVAHGPQQQRVEVDGSGLSVL